MEFLSVKHRRLSSETFLALTAVFAGKLKTQLENFIVKLFYFFVFEKVNIILFRAKFISKQHARDRARNQNFRAMDARRITVKRQNQYASYQAPSFQYL